MKANFEYLYQLKIAYENQFNDLINEYKINFMEISILLFLKNNPNIDTAKEMLRLRFNSKSHLSTSINNLVNLGFIERIPDNFDRRLIHLKLTTQSNNIVKSGIKLQKTFYEKLIYNINKKELIEFFKVLDKISINANNEYALSIGKENVD